MDSNTVLAHCINYRAACQATVVELDQQPAFIRGSAPARRARKLAVASLALVEELERRCREELEDGDAK